MTKHSVNLDRVASLSERERTFRDEFNAAKRLEYADGIAPIRSELYEAVCAAVKAGAPKSQVASAAGISRSRVYEILREAGEWL